MLTIFTTAKPFQGHNGIIQRNALKSWTLLPCDIEVILFGNEEGAGEVCTELGLRHEPHVERSHVNPRLPIATYLFERAQEIARHQWLCYINCDIVVTPDFGAALRKLSEWRETFLAIGRRWDLDINAPLEFQRPNWAQELRQRALLHGTRRNNEIDYFLFRKGMYRSMPALIIGRVYWDYWTVWKALSMGIPVVEVSPMVLVIHQNHDSAYIQETRSSQGVFFDAGAEWNYELAHKGKDFATFDDCTHQLTRSGMLLPTLWRKQRRRTKEFLWKTFIHNTFWLRSRLGIRKRIWKRMFGRAGENQRGSK
jgi:hypothetical protein